MTREQQLYYKQLEVEREKRWNEQRIPVVRPDGWCWQTGARNERLAELTVALGQTHWHGAVRELATRARSVSALASVSVDPERERDHHARAKDKSLRLTLSERQARMRSRARWERWKRRHGRVAAA